MVASVEALSTMTAQDIGEVLEISDDGVLSGLMNAIQQLVNTSTVDEAKDAPMEEGQESNAADDDRSSPAFVAHWIQQHTPPDLHAGLMKVIEEEAIDGAPEL